MDEKGQRGGEKNFPYWLCLLSNWLTSVLTHVDSIQISHTASFDIFQIMHTSCGCVPACPLRLVCFMNLHDLSGWKLLALGYPQIPHLPSLAPEPLDATAASLPHYCSSQTSLLDNLLFGSNNTLGQFI